LAVGLASLAVFAGCSRNNPVAAPPPPLVVVDPFDTAENAYDQGLFVAAANAYSRALAPGSPTPAPDQELAIARLALIYSMPDSPLHDIDQARTHLTLLEERFPGSNQGAPARTMITLQSRIALLESTVEEMQTSLDALRSTIGEFETAATEQATTIHSLQAEVDRLQISLSATRTELETLREIDRQLRQRN
jgi:hypothetical protein